MNTEIASGLIAMFYLMIGGITLVGGIYFIYWMMIELPVLLRIKREQLYDRWKYPNLNGRGK